MKTTSTRDPNEIMAEIREVRARDANTTTPYVNTKHSPGGLSDAAAAAAFDGHT